MPYQKGRQKGVFVVLISFPTMDWLDELKDTYDSDDQIQDLIL